MNNDLPPTLYHAKDRRLFLRQCATAGFAFTSASTALSALALDDCGLPFMAGAHVGFIALHLVGEHHQGLFFTIPARRCAVLCCTSLPWSTNAWVIGAFDPCSPIKYSHKIQTCSG